MHVLIDDECSGWIGTISSHLHCLENITLANSFQASFAMVLHRRQRSHLLAQSWQPTGVVLPQDDVQAISDDDPVEEPVDAETLANQMGGELVSANGSSEAAESEEQQSADEGGQTVPMCEESSGVAGAVVVKEEPPQQETPLQCLKATKVVQRDWFGKSRRMAWRERWW